jgi:peptidyl-prolyl cis-trans isomerase SurA
MIVGLPLLAILLVAGCNRPHGDDVVASVNGHSIMRADMERMYRVQLGQAQAQAQAQGQAPELSPEQADSLRLQVVHELIEQEIVAQRAAKMNLSATPEDVDAKLAEMKAPYTEEQFAAQLQASNQTLDDVRRDLRRNLTIEKLINKEIKSKVTVTDADVATFYNQHKADFNLIEPKYDIAEIRVTGVPSSEPGNLQGSKATTDAEAVKKIQALKTRLDAGEDFGQLAANFSENPATASSGGDMGFLAESQLRSDPTVYAAVVQLKPGQITPVLPLVDPATRKPVAYAIFKLLAREPAGQRDLSDPAVQQNIRQQLRDGRSQLLQTAYYEMLRDQAKVENFLAEDIYKNDAK